MAFRVRTGPITWGRSGPRLSMWSHVGGLSMGRRQGFGVLLAGPFRWWFGVGNVGRLTWFVLVAMGIVGLVWVML